MSDQNEDRCKPKTHTSPWRLFMRSDHWNFLANLLGTPGPAEPPKKKAIEEKTEQIVEAEVETPKPEVAKTPSDSDEKPLEPVSILEAEQVKPDQSSTDPADVLEALTSVTPPPVLPGFGAAPRRPGASSYERPPVAKPDPDALDAAITDLAHETSSDSRSKSGSRSEAAGDEKPSRSRAPESKRSDSVKKPAVGFGQGLIDSDDEDGWEEVESAPEVSAGRKTPSDSVDADDDQPWGSPARSHRRPDRQDQKSSSGSPESRDSSESRRRPRSEESESNRPRRGRGRRGARQRTSGDEVAKRDSLVDDRSDELPNSLWGAEEETSDRETRDEVSNDRSSKPRDEKSASDRPRRRGGQGRSRGRSRGRDREAEPSFELDRDSRDVDDVGDDSDSGSEIRSESDGGQKDESEPRTRRRGRRGRGRGRGRGRSGNDSPSTSQTDGGDQKDIPTSAFDDDHEDDIEVETIRRGRRPEAKADRARSGRGRADRGSESASRDDETPSRRRSRRPSEDASTTPRPRREDVPTWLETVELFVNANVENHKKKGSGGGEGRGGRGRKR